MKYRKKPVVIEAVQWKGGVKEFREVIYPFCGSAITKSADENVYIDTLEGRMTASIGDWIIKGVNEEFYPCKPDIFEKTYEAV
jgi:hypothetical protein